MRRACVFFFRCTASLLLLAAGSVESLSQTVLYSDAFDGEVVGTQFEGQITPGAVGTTGWTFVRDEPNQSDIRFGYDYSAISIPEAPNSDPSDPTTTGVSLRTNVAAGAVDQAGIYYDDAAFTGNYQVQVDMWLNWANDAEQIGTTEHGGLFIGKDTVSNPANADFPAATGAGTLFSSDGQCSNCDHLLLKNSAELDTFSGQYSVRQFDLTPSNQNPGNQNGFDNTDVNTDPANGDLLNLAEVLPEFTIPNSTDLQAGGTVGFRWVTLTAEVNTAAMGSGAGSDLGTTTFSLTNADNGESYTLGTIDNSVIDDPADGIDTGEAAVDMSGRVSLVITDFFTSVSSELSLGTVVFDNLIVTAIEDTMGLAADFNGDGTVDLLDLDILGSGFGGPGTSTTGDANGDGTVDLLDLDILGSQFGMSTGAVSVPEPTSLAMGLFAAGLLAACRRRS